MPMTSGLRGAGGAAGLRPSSQRRLGFSSPSRTRKTPRREPAFVFAGIDADGSDPIEIGAETRDETLGVGHAAGEQQGVYFGLRGRRPWNRFLGDLVDHGVEDLSGLRCRLHRYGARLLPGRGCLDRRRGRHRRRPCGRSPFARTGRYSRV